MGSDQSEDNSQVQQATVRILTRSAFLSIPAPGAKWLALKGERKEEGDDPALTESSRNASDETRIPQGNETKDSG
jgi:hypothetical protein